MRERGRERESEREGKREGVLGDTNLSAVE